MEIKGASYNVSFDNRKTLTLTGKLAAMPEEYQAIEDLFTAVLQTVDDLKEPELILDLRDLVFLNSSGIKTVCVSLVMEADEIEGIHLKILCNNSLTWQVESLPTFTDLMSDLEIVFE